MALYLREYGRVSHSNPETANLAGLVSKLASRVPSLPLLVNWDQKGLIQYLNECWGPELWLSFLCGKHCTH